MKRIISGAGLGGAIGAAATILVLVALNAFVPERTLDMFSFGLVIVGIVITALTLLGGFTLVNTWNDIDARTRAIVEKYERDANAEIERNAKERQQAINEAGERGTATIQNVSKQAQGMLRRNQWILGAVGAWLLVMVMYMLFRIEQMDKRIPHKDRETK